MISRNNVLIESGILLKAGGLIIKDGRVLLVSSNGKYFCIPKGHVERGEQIEECAVRELEEETGYKVKIIKKLSFINYTNKEINQPIKLQYFLFEIIGGKEKAEKGTFLKWFNLNDALKVNPYENEKEVIRRAYG
ncbi:MAG: NUDIX domain-containing protein [Patescibacteria group bacterium]|nr:NUDIX domain-containing protein [Patescibacteria group bacterium]